MTRKLNRKSAIRFILETIDLALRHPDHGTGGDLVGDVAAKMLGDNVIPFERFEGWKPSSVRNAIEYYAGGAPDKALAEMLAEARWARRFLFDFALEQEYERTTGHLCHGDVYNSWRRKRVRAGAYKAWRPDADRRAA